MMRLVISLSFLAFAACKAPVGVNNASLSRDSGQRCAELCGEVGMPLDSLVIMADNVGCVCRAVQGPPPGPAPAQAPGSEPVSSSMSTGGSAGGMAAIMMQEAKRRASSNAQRHNAARRY